MKRLPWFFVLVSSLVAPAIRGQSAQGGRLYELVPFELGFATRTTGVNARAQACGFVSNPPATDAYRWSAVAGTVPLAPVVGYPNAAALELTRSGFVLGSSFSASLSVATLWSPSGTATTLPDLGWTLSEPAAISESGVVVGRGYTGLGQWQPWIWDVVNGTRLLATLGFPAGASVTDVDASGRLAGAPFFGEAFVFDLAGATTTSLGTLGGDSSAALALGESGSVVGWSQTLPANEPAPFFWSQSGGLRSLGTPSGPGNVNGRAFDVNRHDVVVGSFELTPSRDHAFVWDADLGFRDLNTLVRQRNGIELESALDISNTGWIAGTALDHSQGGRDVGYLLRPL
jgi:uncharacterized membrane protein